MFTTQEAWNFNVVLGKKKNLRGGLLYSIKAESSVQACNQHVLLKLSDAGRAAGGPGGKCDGGTHTMMIHLGHASRCVSGACLSLDFIGVQTWLLYVVYVERGYVRNRPGGTHPRLDEEKRTHPHSRQKITPAMKICAKASTVVGAACWRTS